MDSGPVLVTGGCGFVGTRLCADLVGMGREVVIVDNLNRVRAGSAPLPDVQTIVADIRDVATLARYVAYYRPQTVYHLAAMHFIPDCAAHPTECIAINVGGTQALLDACEGAGCVETVVFASSAAVYAPAPTPHREESPLGPTDIYGFTKRWAEDLLHLCHARTGIGVGIARLFNVFGPGETNPHLIPSIIEQVRTGRTLHLGNLTTVRDYVYADDVAVGLMALAAASRVSGSLTCNLGSGQPADGQFLVRLIEEQVGERLAVVQDPARMRPVDRPMLVADCHRAYNLLGWRAETSLRDGVAAIMQEARDVAPARAIA